MSGPVQERSASHLGSETDIVRLIEMVCDKKIVDWVKVTNGRLLCIHLPRRL